MAAKKQPSLKIEFTAGARVTFSSLSNQLQNKLYNKVSQFCTGKAQQLKEEGILKPYKSKQYQNAHILRLNSHFRAYIQSKTEHILILNILDTRLAKRYSE